MVQEEGLHFVIQKTYPSNWEREEHQEGTTLNPTWPSIFSCQNSPSHVFQLGRKDERHGTVSSLSLERPAGT